MANVKISALPAATAVAASDLLPVVQGGVTKQVTPDLLPLSAATAAALAGKDASGAAAAAQAAAVQRVNHTGTQSADTLTDGTTNKAFLATERTKLASIAAGATVNRADAATDAAIAAATAALVNSAPGTLDTLGELASALTADEGAATTLATLVGTKAPLASPAFTGTPTIGGTAAAKTTDITAAVAAQAATNAATYETQTHAASTFSRADRPITPSGAEWLRTFVRAGTITAASPLVGIGDSHTDVTTGAQYLWTQLKTVNNLPGYGLEGVPAAGLIPRGNNGQTLSDYLAGGGTNTLAASLALNPSVILACWLTNDVRQGALGTTVGAIRVAGANLLKQLIAAIRTAQPSTVIVLRVPFPYTTVDDGIHYITDGSTVNPVGLAQTYTDGVRLAYYDAQRAYPDVVLYDPQTRLAGTTSPTANTGYYGDQVHQSQGGYMAEADDFAAFVAGQPPYQPGRAVSAQAQAPAAPWTIYYRDPEDTVRYVKVFEGTTGAATAGQTYLDMVATNPPVAAPNNLAGGDIIVYYEARTAVEIPSGSSFYRQSATIVRYAPASGGTPALSSYGKVAIFRRITGTDGAVNTVLYDKSYRFKRYGRVLNGSTGFVDIGAAPLTGDPATIPMSETATSAQAGDQVYIEGHGSTPITLSGGSYAANGSALRIFGGLPDSFDYSTVAGKMAVVVGSHA